MTAGKRDTRLTQGGKTAIADHDFVNPPIVRGSTVLHSSVATQGALASVSQRRAWPGQLRSFGTAAPRAVRLAQRTGGRVSKLGSSR